MLKRAFHLLPRAMRQSLTTISRPRSAILADLPNVPPATRPASFVERQEVALNVEGMMSPFSMQLMDAILAYQEETHIQGPLFEAGVWKGRSSSIISAHVRDGESFILSDVNQLLTADVLSTALYVRPVFVHGPSREFSQTFDMKKVRRKVRFAHIDSSHSYRDTLAEMALVDEIMAPNGVACLDDFANLDYSQILPAVFKYLYTNNTDLTFFLVTNDKGYLCRRPFFCTYGSFVLHRLLNEMRARNSGNVVLSRTDADPEYRAFYLRAAQSGEVDPFYGTELYAEFYKAP